MTRTPLFFIAAAALLAGCGDDPTDTVVNVLNTTADVLSAGTPQLRPRRRPLAADGFTPEEVAANPDDYRLFTINALGVAENWRAA